MKKITLEELFEVFRLINIRNNSTDSINILKSRKIDFDIEVYGIDEINRQIKEILGL